MNTSFCACIHVQYMSPRTNYTVVAPIYGTGDKTGHQIIKSSEYSLLELRKNNYSLRGELFLTFWNIPIFLFQKAI